MTAGLGWAKQDAPRWDAEKQALFGAAELAATGLPLPEPDAPLADEWFRVTDTAGVAVGYGWLDSEWGDAQITFVVAPAARGAGVGSFILDGLEREAAARGVNYIYNVVPDSHPDPAWMTAWLTDHGFRPGTGDLRRRVRPRD